MIGWQGSTLWKYAVRQMRRRPGRTLLTLAGISLGVATIVAVTLTTQATRSAYHEMFAAVTGRASLEVVAEGFGGFDEAVVARLENVSGVEAVLPVVQSAAALVSKSGPVPVLVLGIDPARDEAARDYVLHAGRPLEVSDALPDRGGLLVEASFAQANGCELGRPARLWTPTGLTELPVVGLLKARGAMAFNGGAVVFMPLTTAQRVFALPGQINSVQIVLTEGSDAASVQGDLLAQLPAGLRVQAPSARGERARDALYSIEQALASVSLVTLVAAAFVILNTFLINLTERRRQLAIFRALGATRRQVTGLLLREAALFGLVGTVLGIGAGYLLALGILGIMEQVLGGLKLPDLRWTNEALLLALIFGPGMALVATWLPARQAGRRAPLEDLLARGGVHTEEPRRWPAYLGLMLIGMHLLAVLGLAQGWLTPALLAPIMPVGVIGAVLVLPLVIGPLMRFAGVCLRGAMGLEGRLAIRQLQRRPARTALTVGILSIALFVGIGVGHALVASVRDTREWSKQVAAADFYVRGTMPDGAYAITMAMLPESFEAELARLEGVERVDKLNWIPARAHDQRVVAIACTFPADRPPALDLVEGAPAAVLRGLMDGEVVLGIALAQRLRLKVGDEVVLETRDGLRPLRIAGTANEYTIDGMALYLQWHTAKKLFRIDGVHVFLISAAPGKASAVGESLKVMCRERHLILHSQAELRSYIDQAVLGIAGLMWGLMGLVFVVASLGIVNTLTMNVLEQTRELGMLRAVGLKRGQLRKLVVSQALAVGLISLVPGTVIGLALAYLSNMLSHILLGHAVAFRIEIGLVAGCLAAAMVITVLAALLPARRAARLQVVQALQYE
jgi:putative ABC transport system permease protein